MANKKTLRHPNVADKDLAAKRKLYAKNLKLSNAIEAERGLLPESFPLIREDRER